MSKFRILLLTNRDSDNVGDQIIEATAISLLKAAWANLGFSGDDLKISSRAAGIVSKAYMRTGDPALLQGAKREISQADLIVFGGAPLFNYTYQNFYLRTIKTLEIADEHNVPVLFSSIGVEPYDAHNEKSQALKKALALPCVKQITTRDDFDSLKKYVEGTDVAVSKVADPAVFAQPVFRKASPNLSRNANKTRTVGLVVTRAGIFKDNGIDFSEQDQKDFWLNTISALESRGYEYRVFTTGHFTDEIFLDSLIRDNGVPSTRAAVTVNSPEELIEQLQACDGVVAYRLHASITSYAFGIPSVGLSWNFKVPYFYESVGYGDRALAPSSWTSDRVVAELERAMEEGVTHDQDFMMTVYQSLFHGIKHVLAESADDTQPYGYGELCEALPPYAGTSFKSYRAKTRRKLRRIYAANATHSAPVGNDALARAVSIASRMRRRLGRVLGRQ